MSNTEHRQTVTPLDEETSFSDIECPACEQPIPTALLNEGRIGQGRTFRCPTPGCTETFHFVRRGQDRFDLRFSP
ncbi:MAG: hypothetical protein ACE5Q6_03875 [Dehalococcoidia bacterium]